MQRNQNIGIKAEMENSACSARHGTLDNKATNQGVAKGGLGWAQLSLP